MGWGCVLALPASWLLHGSDLQLVLAFHRRCWSMSCGLPLALKSQRANLRGWILHCGGLVLVDGARREGWAKKSQLSEP